MESRLSSLATAAILADLEESYKILEKKDEALNELLTLNFDEEQIWQQMELHNSHALKTLKKTVNAAENESHRNLCTETSTHILEKDDSDAEESEARSSEEEEELVESVKPKAKYGKKSEVDDSFFRLQEMEDFLDGQEKQGQSDDDTNISFSDDEEDETDLYYGDFFDPPPDQPSTSGGGKERKVTFHPDVGSASEKSAESDPDNALEGARSTLEEREQRLRAMVEEKEEENLKAKSWEMAGEVEGEQRPANSLLEHHLVYDLGTKPAPVITQDHTERLEDIILQRIKDRAWDDVERKEKPVLEPTRFRNEIVLDHDKSKASLGDIYEQEFMKQKQKEKEEAEIESHEEIKRMMRELFRKLDALTNYHYTPNKAAPELKIVNNVRSLEMEDVAPIATNTETLLAPEEIKEGVGESKGDSEKTEEDRNRERRKKKKMQRARGERRMAKDAGALLTTSQRSQLAKIGALAKPKLDPSLVKKGKGKVGTSSADFFNKLQDEVSGSVRKKKKAADTADQRSGASWKL